VRKILLLSTMRAYEEDPYVFAKSLVSAFLISNSIRRDVTFYLVLDDRVMRFEGSRLRQLRADELTAWGIIRKAVRSRSKHPHPGVFVLDRKSLDISDNIICISRSSPLVKPRRGMGLAVAYPEADYPFNCIKGRLSYTITLPHHLILLYHYILDQEEFRA